MRAGHDCSPATPLSLHRKRHFLTTRSKSSAAIHTGGMNSAAHASPLVPASTAEALFRRLPTTTADIVEAVTRQLPIFADALQSELGKVAQAAIDTMLAGFLGAACGSGPDRQTVDIGAVQQAAFNLGRYEARIGRSIDPLNAAFRLGARIAWRHWSTVAQDHDMNTADIVRFAELHFEYLDDLADACVSGHADELATASRRLQRQREQLAEQLLLGAGSEEIMETARLARWQTPATMVAIVLARADTHHVIPLLDDRTLRSNEDLLPGLERSGLTTLLVPVTTATPRPALIRRLTDVQAAVGPEQPWLDVKYSAALAARARKCCQPESWPIDTEKTLAELVIHADPQTRERQRAAALAPFDHLRADTRARYEETLRAWLLHQGRREHVARQLVLHTQTVRYRMDRIREILGDDLNDPARVLDLVIALA
ncbi:PucR family transcriptional regulator [Mycobacterium sp. pUA109]|uniref:PucR family transcriptional regulator n=1 Tax=Mycobacterium sp. pUA109 TaxID=3238982 RepID=UPI00351ACCCB